MAADGFDGVRIVMREIAGAWVREAAVGYVAGAKAEAARWVWQSRPDRQASAGEDRESCKVYTSGARYVDQLVERAKWAPAGVRRSVV